MNKDSKVFLHDILYSIDRINEITKTIGFDDFTTDMTIQDATIRRLSVIGEAANNIPSEIKEKHKAIEWKKIMGMRNFLIHEYFEIDMKVIWDTIKQDLPKLKTEITKMLKENAG